MPKPTSPIIELSELEKALLIKISRAHTSRIREVERGAKSAVLDKKIVEKAFIELP